MQEKSPVALAGLGNEHRRDDGAGQVVAAGAAARLPEAWYLGCFRDSLDLCGRWDQAWAAVIVDAVRSGAPAGTVHVVDLSASVLEGEIDASPGNRSAATTSTHSFGITWALRLGWAIGQAPARLVLVGVEGQDFSPGCGLSAAVEAAIPVAVSDVVRVVEEFLACV
jgi:hydrogenase maturation protease